MGENGLYRNKGDGTFEDVTKKAGVGLGDRVCVGATWADYDNDGHLDLFVTSTRGGNVLFHNNGDGTFSDVTKKAGLVVKPTTHSQTAVFFDFDNDGFLDLLVTNTARWTSDKYDRAAHYYPGVGEGTAPLFALVTSQPEHNAFYRNNRDGTFTDVTEKVGLKGKGWGGDVAVFDYDGDGRLDVLVTNMFGASQLYRNNPDNTFTDVTRDVLGKITFGAIGAKTFDFNNDGRLDLFITDMHSDMWLPPRFSPDSPDFPPGTFTHKFSHIQGFFYEYDPRGREREHFAAHMLKIPYQDVVFGNTLFKQVSSGKFEEVSDKAGMETWWPWGIATGDFDNDGFEDVFLPSGMGYPFHYWPNSLMMNNGNETFTNCARLFGIDPPPGGKYLEEDIGGKPATRSSRAAAVADFTNTGRLDLVVSNFNDRAFYFRNNFTKKNYVAFCLRGTKSNRDAIGALVKVYSGKEVMVRQVQAAGGYLSQSSKVVHFGLGDRPKIDRVEIRWPVGKLQTIHEPAINTHHQVTEP
jgi:hypothetical protein